MRLLVMINANRQIFMNKDIHQLERALRRMKKPTLNNKARLRMRNNLMKRMEKPAMQDISYPSLEKVGKTIKRYAEIQPSFTLRAKMKEVIMNAIANRPIRLSPFGNIARQWQKALAALVITMLSITSLTVYFSDIPVIRAAQKTTFQNLHGDVDVMRDGEMIKAYRYMTLEEGDIVITGENGLAIIRYFDDSVSRLYSRTELKMQRLYQDHASLAKTKVEVELERGRVWNQVVNLIYEQGSFEISTDTMSARTSGKASFDVTHDDIKDKAAIAVFENKVEVSFPEKRKENKKMVIEGYTYEVEDKVASEKRIALHDETDKLWVKVNQAEDKNYKKQIEEEKVDVSKKEAGVLPAEPLYSAKKLNETTKLLVTNNDLERDKIQIDIAVKRLMEASALLSDGNEEDAQDILEEFSKRIEDVENSVKQSADLQNYAYTVFESKAKDYSTTLPDGSRYKAKEALREAQLSLALSGVGKSELMLKKANERIGEARELFSEKKQEEAQEVLLQAMQEIVNVSREEKNGNVVEHEQKEETLATVRAFKSSFEGDNNISQEAKQIVDLAEEALTEVEDPAPESDSAVVISVDEDLNDRATVQLKEVPE